MVCKTPSAGSNFGEEARGKKGWFPSSKPPNNHFNKKYLWSNINNNYKLNYIPSNHNLYNNSNINKNGKYNIKVKLNFI